MLGNFSQQSHPRLWLIFQHLFGALKDKRRLARTYIGNHKSILEIGCSLGVVAEAFKDNSDISYLGIDIDDQAVQFSRQKFSAYKHMSFSTTSMESLALSGSKFDYVLFANILHHVNDAEAVNLLKVSIRLLSKNGTMIIMEPDILTESDPLLVRAHYKLERGLYRRSLEHLLQLTKEASIVVNNVMRENVSMGALPGVTCSRILLLNISEEANRKTFQDSSPMT